MASLASSSLPRYEHEGVKWTSWIQSSGSPHGVQWVFHDTNFHWLATTGKGFASICSHQEGLCLPVPPRASPELHSPFHLPSWCLLKVPPRPLSPKLSFVHSSCQLGELSNTTHSAFKLSAWLVRRNPPMLSKSFLEMTAIHVWQQLDRPDASFLPPPCLEAAEKHCLLIKYLSICHIAFTSTRS